MNLHAIFAATLCLPGCIGSVDSIDTAEDISSRRDAVVITYTTDPTEQCVGVPDMTECQVENAKGLCVDDTCSQDAWDAKYVGGCATEKDCPVPDASSCLERRCDPSGAKTSVGLPMGCYLEPAAPGTDCSFMKGVHTCPGNCSGSAPMYDCEPLEPHCGGY